MPILERETSCYPAGLLGGGREELELPSDDDERRWWAVYTKARQEKAELVWDLFRELLESTDMTPPLRRLLHAGQESAAHAGMVRSMVKAELGLEWWQLQAAVLRV